MSILLRQLVEGLVREGTDEVQVTDDWPRFRAWREAIFPMVIRENFRKNEQCSYPREG